MAPRTAITANGDNQFSTLGQLFRERASDVQSSPTIGFYDRFKKGTDDESHASFLECAADFALEIRSGGLQLGDPVVIACSSPRATMLSYVASVLVGAIPAILPVRAAFDDREAVRSRIVSTCKLLGSRTKVIAERRQGQWLAPLVERASTFAIEADRATRRPLSELPIVEENVIAHFQLTSGSTGENKAVAVSHQNVLTNAAAIAENAAYGNDGVYVGWLPMYHDMGLVSQALSPFVANIDLYVMSPFDFLSDPIAWLRLISEKRGTMSASPAFGYDLVTQRVTSADIEVLDLSSWRAACCGAEPISASVMTEFSETFAEAGLSATAFAPCYGLAEATLAVTMTDASAAPRTIRVQRSTLSRMGAVTRYDSRLHRSDRADAVALGSPIRGVDLHLLDDDGNRIVDDLVCGEVIVTGQGVALGTVRDGGNVVAFPETGVPTGDVGFLEGGELFVVERIKNIIIRNGQNYSASVLEQTLAELVEIEVDKILVVDLDINAGSGLVGVIEIEKGVDVPSVLARVESGLDRFDPPLEEVLVVKKGQLPRTTSGKKRHMAVRELINSSQLQVIESLAVAPHTKDLMASPQPMLLTLPTPVENANDDERLLLEVVAEQVRVRGLDVPVMLVSTLHHDLDFDSLGLLELAMIIEGRFDIRLSRESVAEVRTVGDLLVSVRKARSEDGEVSHEGLVDLVKKVRARVPQYYTTVEEVRANREVKIDGRWINDFASGCYMALDEDERVIEASSQMTSEWGLQRGWTRAVASPKPLVELEGRLAASVGVPDVMIFGTVTLLHFGVLPLLAGQDGAIVIDTEAHKSMHEASALARAKGSTVTSFKHGNTEDLRSKLAGLADKAKRIVVLDGVYSMKGHTLDLPEYQRIAEEFDAILYIDDAHGYGILGENPTDEMPYGFGGNGMVKHLGCTYDRIIYVGGLTKSYSAMLAFITCPTLEYKRLFQLASTMIFVHAPPISTIAQAHAVLDINESDGAAIRERLYSMTKRLIDGAKALGFEVRTSSFPIVNVVMGDLNAVIDGCQTVWDHGLLITPAVFPAAAIDKGGLRFTVTASNTHEQIDIALEALAEIRETQANAIPRSLAAAG